MAPLDLKDVDIDRDGYGLLRGAIEDGDLENVKLLVEAGANPHIRDSYGYSHLHVAAQKGHLGIVKYLHSQGANIKNKDNGLTTPLWLAACHGDLPLTGRTTSHQPSPPSGRSQQQQRVLAFDTIYH